MPGSHLPTFGAEMFPRNQCSKPTFRKSAEHYVAYSALNVIYHDTISFMYQHIQAKMHQMCVLYNTLFSREENFAKSEFEIFSREDIFANLLFTRKYLPAKISSRENRLPVSSA